MDDDRSSTADDADEHDQLQIRIPLKLDDAGRAVVEVRSATLDRAADEVQLVVVDKLAHRTLDWTVDAQEIPGAAVWSGTSFAAPVIAREVSTILRSVLPRFYEDRVGAFSTPPAAIRPGSSPSATEADMAPGTPPGPGDPGGDL